MDERDLEEYHNIGKAIKKSEKYNYINAEKIIGSSNKDILDLTQ